jgi:hypothetical protein
MECANEFAPDESMTVNDDNDTKDQPEENDESNRSFGITDIWSIRRNARKFKIHDRIPRL